MTDRTQPRRRAARTRATLGAAVVAACALLPAAAQATPAQLVTCRGQLSKATPTSDDPFLTNYAFHCSGDIQSYSIVVTRTAADDGTLDDFNTTPTVDTDVNDAPGPVSTTETADCTATVTPGNGINCFATSSATPAVLSAYDWLEGDFDLTAPYCPSRATKTAKNVTPGANVELVVTDSTGAEWGPFQLGLTKRCPAVKPVAKKKTKSKKK